MMAIAAYGARSRSPVISSRWWDRRCPVCRRSRLLAY